MTILDIAINLFFYSHSRINYIYVYIFHRQILSAICVIINDVMC